MWEMGGLEMSRTAAWAASPLTPRGGAASTARMRPCIIDKAHPLCLPP